ncbi:hypothetical protein QY97_03964 [Bacillus thermotolerans]|uniref:Uncharacterized protein n=1 Tax=Bacillus thermotolerans TaxID=1221996 RepID=A0A0F5HWE6_BACTR|nr:hypothetical protein QY97_03964 [Bacillus thermotolerans]KKB42171.1 hypothetical protein QY96_01452 [Bacillus thermotolerans]KKB43300.1 hypothetical protein QY95_01545 [Bacillus thermotolerans]
MKLTVSFPWRNPEDVQASFHRAAMLFSAVHLIKEKILIG